VVTEFGRHVGIMGCITDVGFSTGLA
jgi:hypothetical protein